VFCILLVPYKHAANEGETLKPLAALQCSTIVLSQPVTLPCFGIRTRGAGSIVAPALRNMCLYCGLAVTRGRRAMTVVAGNALRRTNCSMSTLIIFAAISHVATLPRPLQTLGPCLKDRINKHMSGAYRRELHEPAKQRWSIHSGHLHSGHLPHFPGILFSFVETSTCKSCGT
jgi:hypothetical protein